MNKLIDKIKNMNKIQKVIGTIILIILFAILCLIINRTLSQQGTIKKASPANTTSESIKKEITEQEAITQAKAYYGLKSQIKSDANFHSVSRVEVTDTTASKDYGGTYRVTLKGNASGYTDDYDTKFKRVKFTAIIKVSETGVASFVSIDTSSV